MSKLDDLRAMVEAMTEAPWYGRSRFVSRVPDSTGVGGTLHTNHVANTADRDDATGIAALRNAAPALLDIVDAVDAMLTAVDAALPGELYHRRRAEAVDKLRAARKRLEDLP